MNEQEKTRRPFEILPPTPENELPAITPPTHEMRLEQAFGTDWTKASDDESRRAAATLAREARVLHAMSQLPKDHFKTEEERYAAASKMVEQMTGVQDYDGKLWNGGKGFSSGADYLRNVQEAIRRGMAGGSPELLRWEAMSDEEKDAMLDREQGLLSSVTDSFAKDFSGLGELVRGVPQLSAEERASAPKEVRDADFYLDSFVSKQITSQELARHQATVSNWRREEWPRLQRRMEYEAKLRRQNAALYLPSMIQSLETDEAKELAYELARNPSAIPDNWTARLKRLDTRDIETLAQIRGMTREQTEGGFFNWLGDMAIGVYNGAQGILSGVGAQGAKAAAMMMGWNGEQVNEMIRRKHALWSAYAGWSSPAAQLSDQHGAVANFTIGLASSVPFIASMHLKGLGYAACAGEMMSAADAQAAAAGIDTTSAEYNAINLVAGGTYAYMLKAVSPKFFGASANGASEEMALRTAFMKGVMSGVANLDTAKIMSQRTASGALMMAMQQAISAVNADLHLGGDAWHDAAKSFTETFVSSIPDMLAFSAHGALEGHARASGGWRKMFTAEGRANRSQNLREAVENAFAVRAAVDGDRGVDARMQVIRLQQLQHMADAYTALGKKGLLNLGLKPEVVEEAASLFDAERREYGDAKARELEWRRLDSQLDGQTLEELDADTLNRRNDAKRRFDQMMESWDARREHLFESMKDVPGTLRDLASVRDVWAQGHAVGAGKTDGSDAGAAALVKAGFTPNDAAILSREFGAERRGFFSPASTEALREMYTRSTRGMVEAHAALASAFKGKVRTEEGRVLIDLPMPDGGTGTLAVETVDLSREFYGETGSAPGIAYDVERAVAEKGGNVKAEDWIKMSDADRRRVVKKYNLVDEGYFMLTDPADPSLHVDSGAADAVMGVIRLDPRADPGAGFHEAMHGFLRFCRETGYFDEADIKWLQDKYGTPQNDREQLNEESAADGFRQYLAKRMAGSFVADEPGPFRKLFGLIGRLRHLHDSRAATERLAANAEEALYDAFLAGKYQHVRDLKFAEPAAPKAETGTGTEAPQTGAPLDKSAPTEQKLVQPQVPETQGQTAVVDESGATSQKLVQPTAPRVVSFEALTPTGGKKVKGHYEIVPLASLLHSNMAGYPMELQQRDRKGNKGEEQTREEHIANFEPGYLLADPKTDSGAMVVARRPGPDGKPQLVVVSGNGRTMVLEEMAKRNLYDRYRNRMKEWAEENGVENAVADADNPVLVRVVDELGGATLKELADLSNTNAIQQMNEEEQARADADLVRSLDLARLYKPNMDGSANMSAGASDEFFREFVRATGDTSLLNSDGSFTEALRMRARRALLAIACGQGPRGRDVVKKLVEDTDALGIDRQKDAAAAIAPHVAAAESRPEYAIGPDVSRAFADYIEFRENRDTGKKWGTLEEFLKQGDMLDPRSEIAEAVMRLLDDPKGAPVLAETVRLYAEAAKGESDGLFGAARSRAEIWRDAAKAAGEKVAVETMLANRRYSIVAEKVRPVTEKEFDAVLEKTGEQKDITWENIHAACWLLPNGKVPKETLQPVVRGGPAVQPAHESFFPLLDRKGYEDEAEAFVYGYADTIAGGAIRLNLESGGIEVGRRLTKAQRDSLYDILSEGYKRMELGEWPEDTLRVDIDDPFGRTRTSLEFRRGTSPFHVMNEIDAAFAPQKRYSITVRGEKDEWVDIGPRQYIKKTNQPPNRSYGSDPGLPGATEEHLSRSAACRAIDSLDSLPNLAPRVKAATGNFKQVADAIASGKPPKGFRNPVTAENLLGTLTAFGFTKQSPTSAYLVLPDVSIRIADHTGDADRFKKDSNWSIVLESRRFQKPFNAGKKNVVEFKIRRDYLKDSPEKLLALLQSMSEFAVNGEIHDTVGALDYKFSGSDEYVTDAIERLKDDARAREDMDAVARLNADLPAFKKNFFGDWQNDPKNASKVVDEKGRPLVVYRGAQFDPLAQEPGKGVIMPEAYFTADPKYAERYGTVRAYFLNIRHPFDIRDPECLADLKKAYPNHVFQTGKSGALDWAEASIVDGEFLRDNFGSKYDGIIYDEGGDPTQTGGVKYRGLSYVPLDGGAQAKLAIENNGDFSGHPDARYYVTAQRVTPEEDAAYADAVKRGDMETVRRMEREVYERMGYSDDSSYQGTSAFNGAAPSRNAYFETKAERIEAAKNGEMEDTTTLGDFRDGIDVNNLQFIVFDPRSERNADPMRQEAIRNIRDVLDGGKDTITMYRSVPADVKEGQFRNGDWITPSRAYAEDNARIHGWGKKFRVIEQEVSVEDVWWDGNDIAEWGFDDGRGSVYKNTRANRKLLGPTYDNAGNLIPLSKRFNDWHMDARYSIAGRVAASNMGIKGAAEAEAMEKAGKDREEIWRTTGWWRGKDGKWRVEIPDFTLKMETIGREANESDPDYFVRKRKLSDIITDTQLFDAYPELKKITVETPHHDTFGGSGVLGDYNGKKRIRLNTWAMMYDPKQIRSTLGHEIQHVIQRIEGFAKGGNEGQFKEADPWALRRKAKAERRRGNETEAARLEAEAEEIEENALEGHVIENGEVYEDTFEAYRSLAGETESRNVEKRLSMTPEERAATPPWATEDVPADRQIVRYSLKAGTASDYTWATLTAKPDMQLAQIDPEKFKNYETDSERVKDAHKSVIAAGGEKIGDNYYIRMDGERVLVGNAGIKHRGRKANLANDFVFPVLGEVLKNAVRVNELEPRANKKQDKFATDIFVYLGGLSYGQEVLPVRIQVEHRGRERRIDRIDVLRSLNTKIGTVAALGGLAPATPVPGTAAAFGGLAPAYQPLPTISISNLIRIAQPLHPDIFSRDVAANLNVPYSGTKIGARYSVTARTPSDEIKADPESFARRSIVSRVIDGDAEERESALVAFVAERALRHGPKPNAFKTIARLGLEMGLKTVDASRIVKKGEALADRVRGTVIEKAIRKGDVATATALLAREADIDRLVAGAAGQGGQLVRAGEGKIKSILDREIEKHIRSFNAASLADVERDTGIDIAGEILANSPERFDPKGTARREEGKLDPGEVGGEEEALGSGAPDEGYVTDFERARRERVRKEAEERVAKMIATAKQRSEAAKKEREEWEAKREERKRQAEAAAAAAGEGGEAGGGAGGGEGGGSSDGQTAFDQSNRPKLSTFADFKTPEEFAAFFRVWAEERYKKEHGASTLGKHEEKRLFPEFYRKAVVKELQDLADKLLPPKGARATVNRWLGEIQPGVKPDTLERISADIFKFINRNAIRESRTATIQKFRNGLQEFIKGPQFDDLKLDSDRKVTGWVEEAARYIRRVCNLSIQSINGEPSQLEKERAELQAILDRREKVYDDEGKNSADAPLFDMETRRALAKLQLLEKYGAMKRYMPGEIADLADEAMTWLRDEAGKLEANWESARETEKSIRAALTGGIVGPSGQKYKRADGVKGWAERLFDSMNGMIRLRLQHLVRFADAKSQQKARDAINRVVVMLGDGEVAFARNLQDDRAAFHQALAQIFQRPGGKGVDRRALADWLNRMTEAIPADLSRRLSKQGYGDSMTYGQMLQLLVSLEQKSYAEAIAANKRDGQADLIRTFETVGPDGRRERVLTDKDILFIDWLRSFYEAKRGMLSEVTKRMTGLPVDSPDPLYCPVKMYMGDRARGMHVDDSAAWDPIGAVFSRRVETLRDFDESASILGQFFDRSAEAAKLAAWAERGSIIRGVFTSAGVQESIRRAFGGGELTKILKQLEETFNGGENIKKSPGEIAAADKAMNWMTYLSLGYNPLSAMKQTTSFTVWANALPGGFKDLWRYMTDVDMATIKHIKESEEYKVRYGNEVGSGHDVASKGLFENPSENPVAAFFRKTSMGLLRKGDFLPGGWIAQGVFRDIYNRHLKEGMDPQAADRLAMTETFNMLEETQQSGRTYNTAALAREHGRLGRLLVQFATSPLQQLQYETQALREVWDLKRYRPTTPDADFEKRYTEAKGKLVRAAVINHVLLPAALHAVTSLYRLAMGYDPEWEQEGWHWSLLRDITLGQFSRVFFIGAISSVTADALITGKPIRDIPALIPAEGVVKLFGNITVTARDVAMLNYERMQKDFDRLLKSTSITRTPYDVIRLATGKAYADREERREKRRRKEEKKAAKQK